jgi:hypothetical protein
MLPLLPLLPAQAPDASPDATQDVALVVDHVSVEGCPAGTLVGTREMLTVGIGLGSAAATTDVLLATPLQVSV